MLSHENTFLQTYEISSHKIINSFYKNIIMKYDAIFALCQSLIFFKENQEIELNIKLPINKYLRYYN